MIFDARLLDISAAVLRIGLVFTYVAGVFFVFAAAGSQALGQSAPHPALVFAAAAAVAVSFRPVGLWARRFTRDLLGTALPSSSEVLDDLEAIVASEADVEGDPIAGGRTLTALATMVARKTRSKESTVWLNIDGMLEAVAVHPPGRLPSQEGLPLDVEEDPHHRKVVAGPTTVGMIAIKGARGIPGEERVRVLDDIAELSAALFSNLKLRADLERRADEIKRESEALRESALRIVEAQDTERRSLERNLHDGAQQLVTALSVRLARAAITIERDASRVSQEVVDVRTMVDQVRAGLREFSAGIYPKVLVDQGIAPALQESARHLAFDLEITSDLPRQPSDVEAAVYFVCSEALQNVAKHAKARKVRVHIGQHDGWIRFEVADDGVGLRPRSGQGAGMQNMSDRISALGGAMEVTSKDGQGTRVSGRLPIRSHP